MDEQAKVNQLLRPGESLLWCGRPDPSVRFTKSDLFVVPFSIFWAGFMIFGTAASVSSGGSGLGFLVVLVPFLAIGAYMTVGRFFYKARRKRQTVYLLTDQRAAVAVGSNNLSQATWRGFPEQVYRHRDKRHVDVVFEAPVGNGRYRSGQVANTGMELFSRVDLGVAFYDVADGDRLLAAMGQRV